MLHEFLANNRDELIARCRAKVAMRPRRSATEDQLKNGIPMFLGQLTKTLMAESGDNQRSSQQISGLAGGAPMLSEIGVSAALHGQELLVLGFSVDQVVHDYGDLCQAITDLAFERDAPFSVDEFRTLNRCLDNAIADAVTEFSFQRDTSLARVQTEQVNERIGFVMHELRNSLSTANLAVTALDAGNLTMTGATGAVLKRSLIALGDTIGRSLAEVRLTVGTVVDRKVFSVAAIVFDARIAADLHANANGCVFTVAAVDPLLGVEADRHLLLAAIANILHNAFKFTRQGTEVIFSAYALGDRVLFDVKDCCGGLHPGDAEKMFAPFSQRGVDRSGLGLGLAIARQSVEADEGTLSVRNLPGTGCILTISLPRHILH